ncbi:MAG: hypothetical protein HOC20_13485 [Chloroflexi bacterium]|jgi:hypothetical protein|nr:hypothetical protein [Chloroflexota bacterium]
MTEEVKDYSGPFDPDMKLENLSKEALMNLVRECSRLYLVLDGHWNTHVQAKYGWQEAFDFDMKVWETMQAYEPGRIAKALNIQGDDVSAYLKILQFMPAFPSSIYDIRWELIDENHGRITVDRCTSLEYFEREGKGGEEPICQIMEPCAFQWTVSAINPKMKVVPTKLPPRKNKDDVPHCVWEVSLDPGD